MKSTPPSFAARFAAACLAALRRVPVGWLCLLCFALRLLHWWWTRPVPGRSNYWRAAELLWGSGTHPPTTFLEPLYPAFLAAVRTLGGDGAGPAIILQILLATLACWALHRLVLALGADRAAAALACLLYAAHPYLIRQTTAFIYLPLLIPLLIATLWSLQRIPKPGASFCFGMAAGLTLLTRADFAPAFLLLAAWLLQKRGLRPLLTGLAAAALVVAPAGLRNLSVDGSALPTRSGFDLLKGNCEYSDRLLPDYSLDLLNDYIHDLLLREAPHLETAGNRAKDRFYRRKAFEFIRDSPLRTLRLKLLNVLYLYSPGLVPTHPVGPQTRLEITESGWRALGVPSREPWKETLHWAFSGLVLVGAAGGILLRRKSPRDLPLFLTLAAYTAVYSAFWPATRLRASFEVVLILYAGIFFCWALHRIAQTGGGRPPAEARRERSARRQQSIFRPVGRTGQSSDDSDSAPRLTAIPGRFGTSTG